MILKGEVCTAGCSLHMHTRTLWHKPGVLLLGGVGCCTSVDTVVVAAAAPELCQATGRYTDQLIMQRKRRRREKTKQSQQSVFTNVLAVLRQQTHLIGVGVEFNSGANCLRSGLTS
jgi:hypothetical protein